MGTKKRKKVRKVSFNYEFCVNGAKTNYLKSEPTEHRYGYVEGEGQFCFKCAYFGIN